MNRYRAAWVLGPDGPVRDAVVETDGGVVVALRPARVGDPPPLSGGLLPGLVNAHLHLELTPRGPVPGGDGFIAWGRRLMAAPRPSDPEAEGAAARAMVAAGAAGAFDISNGGHTAAALRAAGLRGVAQHELLSWGPGLDARLAAAAAAAVAGPVASRPGPHAVYSTPPSLLAAAAAPRGGVPASLHLGEDEGELRLVRDGDGPFRDWLAALGVPDAALSGFGTGRGLVDYVDQLGVLGPELLLVHGVWFSRDEIRELADRRVPLCLCPRSNLHIGGRLPDVPAMVAAGVPLALGTDSLASAPDLDVLGEVAVLSAAFPEVDPVVWLHAATAGGAAALGRRDLGRFVPGAAPGVLWAEADSPAGFAARPVTRWLEPPCPS